MNPIVLNVHNNCETPNLIRILTRFINPMINNPGLELAWIEFLIIKLWVENLFCEFHMESLCHVKNERYPATAVIK